MDDQEGSLPNRQLIEYQRRYEGDMESMRAAFNGHARRPLAGVVAVAIRAAAVDLLVRSIWDRAQAADPVLASGVALVAVGGYGRNELFPYSDVDLMFLLDTRVSERSIKEPIRKLNQALWDCGLRVSAMTRSLAECARFDPENVEFTLSLLDARHLAGDPSATRQLLEKTLPRLITRDRKKCIARLLEVTHRRHLKYGETIFHLEPNVKECPGGLRDAHVCEWLRRLTAAPEGVAPAAPEFLPPDFQEAREFLILTRTFLHLRHGRDDNTLDWRTQDEAAAAPLGASPTGAQPGVQSGVDAAYWMRLYFRHARAIHRRVTQLIEEAEPKSTSLLPSLASLRRARSGPSHPAFELRQNQIAFRAASLKAAADAEPSPDPAHDPDVVLAIFAAVAATGARLSSETEARMEDALPRLSAHLEDGPGLWNHLQAILTGPFAGRALRAMHALGILELVIPEFHGIDALVIRDAYHRYTVDEHTFVLIDTLHALIFEPKAKDLWAPRFAATLRELPHPPLLFLAALLHDTGKGHAFAGHAAESARMARNVLQRLELDPYEASLVLDLVRNHLEMSAALRRDVFDIETIRSFAAHVPTPESLRMLTLFTYADITAVHPDALTPWKAENLWRLYMATSNFLDRNVDDERVAADAETELGEVMHRVHALVPNRRDEVNHFLDGLPRRYLQTRTPDQIRTHFEMAARLAAGSPTNQPPAPLDFRFAPALSELTLVTRDRPMLFASVAGALAAWGMNIITADAFSNAHGVVVDAFRFTDTFRTLELNESERGRFVQSISGVISGEVLVADLLAARRRTPRPTPKVRVESRIDFDPHASTQSTLLQVVAQDTPGLLRALSLTMAEHRCNIEVALVDTEGEMAIDVFYITQSGAKLEPEQQAGLRQSLLEAIEANAS